MTIAKQVEENAVVSIEEELKILLAKKSFTKTEMNRIREIEKTILSEKFETEKVAAIDNAHRKSSSSVIRETEVVKKGVGVGIIITRH